MSVSSVQVFELPILSPICSCIARTPQAIYVNASVNSAASHLQESLLFPLVRSLAEVHHEDQAASRIMPLPFLLHVCLCFTSSMGPLSISFAVRFFGEISAFPIPCLGKGPIYTHIPAVVRLATPCIRSRAWRTRLHLAASSPSCATTAPVLLP